MNPLEVKQPTLKHLTMQQQSRPLKYTDKSRWPTQNQNMNYPKPKTTLKVGMDACDVQSTHAIRLFGSSLKSYSMTTLCTLLQLHNPWVVTCPNRYPRSMSEWKTNYEFNSFLVGNCLVGNNPRLGNSQLGMAVGKCPVGVSPVGIASDTALDIPYCPEQAPAVKVASYALDIYYMYMKISAIGFQHNV